MEEASGLAFVGTNFLLQDMTKPLWRKLLCRAVFELNLLLPKDTSPEAAVRSNHATSGLKKNLGKHISLINLTTERKF